MIKVIVTKNGSVSNSSIFNSQEDANAWIAKCESEEAWGRPHKIIEHPEQVNSQEPLVIHHDEVITVNPDLIIHHDEISTPVADLIIQHEEVRTPNPDLIVHHDEVIDGEGNITPAWDEVVPQPETVIPAWDEIIPQPPIITPAWDESIPQAPAITPAWDESIPQPDIIIPAWIEEVEAEYTIEIIDITDEVNAKTLQDKYDSLWKAANDFQSGQISGAAIGLLTVGVLAQKPKCTAVQAWIKSVWVEYYTRKAGVSLQNNVNLDFSICGNIPYTVPELMEEVSI